MTVAALSEDELARLIGDAYTSWDNNDGDERSWQEAVAAVLLHALDMTKKWED